MNEWILVVIWIAYTGGSHGIAMQEFIGESACLKAGSEIVRQAPDIKYICVSRREPFAIKKKDNG